MYAVENNHSALRREKKFFFFSHFGPTFAAPDAAAACRSLPFWVPPATAATDGGDGKVRRLARSGHQAPASRPAAHRDRRRARRLPCHAPPSRPRSRPGCGSSPPTPHDGRVPQRGEDVLDRALEGLLVGGPSNRDSGGLLNRARGNLYKVESLALVAHQLSEAVGLPTYLLPDRRELPSKFSSCPTFSGLHRNFPEDCKVWVALPYCFDPSADRLPYVDSQGIELPGAFGSLDAEPWRRSFRQPFSIAQGRIPS